MKLAVCGYPPLAAQIQQYLANGGDEIKFFISEFVSAHGEEKFSTGLPLISFFEFRRHVDAGELDGVIIAEDSGIPFTKEIVRVCKLYGVPKVGVVGRNSSVWFNAVNPVYWLEPDKIFIPKLETNLVDGCNLNCKGCTHFANLFSREEIYSLDDFRRDVRQLAKSSDIVIFLLLGGEPLLLKNLDEYLKIARQYLPRTGLTLVTNGLLLPSASQKILDAIRENSILVSISNYPPTAAMWSKIEPVLRANDILYTVGGVIQTFSVFTGLHGGSNPEKSRAVCFDDPCRLLRGGKIYKCPPDALSYRLAERFGIKGFPKATGADIYAENFSSMLDMLDGNIELCGWCSERARQIPWAPTNNPQLTDWLADPDELKNFTGGSDK